MTWVNADSDDHDVVSADRSFGSPMLGPGGTFTWSFARTGTFAYFCSTHPFMKGMVTVQ